MNESERELRLALSRARLQSGEGEIRSLAVFLDLILRFNRKFNLVSRQSGMKELAAHSADSASLAPLIQGRGISSVCDVGSGAGFPGIVLKVMLPSLGVKLVELKEKKVFFLENAITFLKLNGIEIIKGDINQIITTGARFECVVSKAFRPLGEWLEIGSSAVNEGGYVIAMLGRNQPMPDEKLLNASGLELVEIDYRMAEITGNRNILLKKSRICI